MAIAVRLGVIDLQRLAQRLTLFLHAEGQDRTIATDRGRAGAAVEVVRHDDALAGGLVEMYVAVDTAGKDEEAGGVDHLVCVRQVGCERSDPAVLDTDVADEGVTRRHHRSIADHRIEAHQSLLLVEVFSSPWRSPLRRRGSGRGPR
ncbi:hypothetical protein D9M68_478290 [compost metagenome]